MVSTPFFPKETSVKKIGELLGVMLQSGAKTAVSVTGRPAHVWPGPSLRNSAMPEASSRQIQAIPRL